MQKPSLLKLKKVSAPGQISVTSVTFRERVIGTMIACHTYKKAELKSFLQFHRTDEEPLHDDEISILNGVLELNTKNAETIMTPLKVRVVGTFFLLLPGLMHIDASFNLTGYSDFECRHHFGPQGDGGTYVSVYVLLFIRPI